MRYRLPMGLFTLIVAVVVGCAPGSAEGPFGAPEKSKLLLPYAGKWKFDLEKTLAARKMAGVTDEKLESFRKAYTVDADPFHVDLTFDGNVAFGSGSFSSEYRFFRIHNHDKKLCGRAWHHEDRFDPGDMSKCYVQLEIVDEAFRLDVYMQEDSYAENDPDYLNNPPVEGKAEECDFAAAVKKTAHQHAIYMYSRAK